MVIVSCNAAYDSGGLGRHFTQVVEEYRAAGQLARYYAASVPAADQAGAQIKLPWLPRLLLSAPLRSSPAPRIYWSSELFDRAVAARLEPGRVCHGFDGTSMHTFRRARALKFERVEMEGGMSHFLNVKRLWDWACRMHPIEKSPVNPGQVRRFLAEYESADVIWVTSEYSRQTFLAAGVPADKLRRRHLRLPMRFRPPARRPDDGIFRVVYTGFLSPAKGVPTLLRAFHALGGRAELTIVGTAWSSNMRRYVEEWQRRDARIHITRGDPLPHLQRSDVYVHPSFQEGFGYAPMEALACGVPVVVTEDTGMKEHVREGLNGYVVPTGSWEAILERLEHLRSRPLAVPVEPQGVAL